MSLVESIIYKRWVGRLRVEDFISYSQNADTNPMVGTTESANRAEVCRRANAKWRAKQKRMQR